jgi:predicted MPP superfamily phosphohydrolase
VNEKQLSLFIGIIAIAMIIYSIFYILFIPISLRKTALKIISRDKTGTIGKHKLSISSTGIIDVTETGETTTHWDTVESLATTNKYFFTIIRASNSHIVPRRSFPDKEDFRKFAETATAYYQASLTQQPNTSP